jgi:hypothetical protein
MFDGFHTRDAVERLSCAGRQGGGGVGAGWRVGVAVCMCETAARSVTAYGRNATECRASRVELWNRQSEFALGFLYPQTVGPNVWMPPAEVRKLLCI